MFLLNIDKEINLYTRSTHMSKCQCFICDIMTLSVCLRIKGLVFSASFQKMNAWNTYYSLNNAILKKS